MKIKKVCIFYLINYLCTIVPASFLNSTLQYRDCVTYARAPSPTIMTLHPADRRIENVICGASIFVPWLVACTAVTMVK